MTSMSLTISVWINEENTKTAMNIETIIKKTQHNVQEHPTFFVFEYEENFFMTITAFFSVF